MKLLLLPLLVMVSSGAYSAVQIMSSRVIFNEGATSAVVNMTNKGSDPALVQSWIDDGQRQKTGMFVVTPPLLRLNGGKSAVLRIIKSGQPPARDRESVYWVNIKEIPPMSSQTNQVQFAVHSRFKLFYRPEGLASRTEQPGLQWQHTANDIIAVNKSGYYITVNTLTINNHPVAIDMIPPYSSVNVYRHCPEKCTIKWTTINDYGRISDFFSEQI